MSWLRSGATVYALNIRGVNRWSFNVQEGFDDNDRRLSVEECEKVAALAASAPALLEAATKVLSFRNGDLPSQGWLADNSGSRAALASLAEAARAAISLAGESHE